MRTKPTYRYGEGDGPLSLANCNFSHNNHDAVSLIKRVQEVGDTIWLTDTAWNSLNDFIVQLTRQSRHVFVRIVHAANNSGGSRITSGDRITCSMVNSLVSDGWIIGHVELRTTDL